MKVIDSFSIVVRGDKVWKKGQEDELVRKKKTRVNRGILRQREIDSGYWNCMQMVFEVFFFFRINLYMVDERSVIFSSSAVLFLFE